MARYINRRFHFLKSNFLLLVSGVALVGLYTEPTKSSVYDACVLAMFGVILASVRTLRFRELSGRIVRIGAMVVAAAAALGGSIRFAATWGGELWALGLLGSAAGWYAGLIAGGQLLSWLLSLPQRLTKTRSAANPDFWIVKEDRRREALCLLFCLLLIAPLLIAGLYNRPSADDFSYSMLTHDAVTGGEGLLGVLAAAWKTNVHFFRTWQGLYSSAFLLALQPGIFGAKYYALTPWIIILWAYAFTFPSVHLLNRAYLKRSALFSASAALVLVTILVLWLPSPTEGLFWFNGAMNYMPWAFTNVFNICLLLSVRDKTGTAKGAAALVLSVCLSFLTSGGNHVTAFANILFLLILFAAYPARQKHCALLPLAAACIGFAIMYTAPGTAIRAARCEQQSVAGTILAVIGYLFTDVSKWMNVQWLLSLLVITPVGLEVAHKNDWKLPRFFPLVSIILSIGVLCGMLAVPYFSIGNFGAGRGINVIWITFMFLSWYNYIVVLIALSKKGMFASWEAFLKNAYPVLRNAVVAGCLVVLLVFPSRVSFSNSLRALKEIVRGNVQSYAAEWDARDALMRDDSLSEVWVSELSNKSDLLFFRDLFGGDTATTSEDVNHYYGKTVYMKR